MYLFSVFRKMLFRKQQEANNATDNGTAPRRLRNYAFSVVAGVKGVQVSLLRKRDTK